MEVEAEEIDDSTYKDTNEAVDFNRRKNTELSYKQIVLRAIEECRKQGSKQMVKGADVFMKNEHGHFIPQQIVDQRKVWEECVFQLECLLIYIFDDIAEKNIKECKENISKVHTKYLNVYLASETFQPHKRWSQSSGQYHPASTLTPHYIQYEEDEILKQWQKIYQELLVLFKKRKNELSTKRTLGLYEK